MEAVGQLAKSRKYDFLGRVDGERATLYGAFIFLLQRLRGAQEEAIVGSEPECLYSHVRKPAREISWQSFLPR